MGCVVRQGCCLELYFGKLLNLRNGFGCSWDKLTAEGTRATVICQLLGKSESPDQDQPFVCCTYHVSASGEDMSTEIAKVMSAVRDIFQRIGAVTNHRWSADFLAFTCLQCSHYGWLQQAQEKKMPTDFFSHSACDLWQNSPTLAQEALGNRLPSPRKVIKMAEKASRMILWLLFYSEMGSHIFCGLQQITHTLEYAASFCEHLTESLAVQAKISFVGKRVSWPASWKSRVFATCV